MTDIGPEIRHCYICGQPGKAPDLVPYLGEGETHLWAHQLCAWRAWEVKRKEGK